MKKILVVDDNEAVLNLLKTKFSQYSDIEGFYVKTYTEAINIMRRHPKEIEIALLDVILPDAPNGEIITLAKLHNIPVVVLTASLNKKTRDLIQKKSIISYILKNKPSSIDLAVKTINIALKNSNKTVLIAEDSKPVRIELSNMLKNLKLNVIEAKNGEEALDILKNKEHNISMLFVDYNIPILNGLDLTIKARELYNKNELGIIAISSSNDKDIIDDFLTFGANDFISKPFTPSELIAKVNTNIEMLELFIEITDLANKDYMTGAYNRRYFFDSGKSILLKAIRKEKKVAVVTLDIDNFKVINDTYGHDIGDIAIKEIKKILDGNLRTSDLMARFGGEEFCILLEDITIDDTKKLFEKIREAFENNIINANGTKINYTVSFGIAYGLLDTLDDMIKLSDEALYHAKKNGRNQLVIKTT